MRAGQALVGQMSPVAQVVAPYAAKRAQRGLKRWAAILKQPRHRRGK